MRKALAVVDDFGGARRAVGVGFVHGGEAAAANFGAEADGGGVALRQRLNTADSCEVPNSGTMPANEPEAATIES